MKAHKKRASVIISAAENFAKRHEVFILSKYPSGIRDKRTAKVMVDGLIVPKSLLGRMVYMDYYKRCPEKNEVYLCKQMSKQVVSDAEYLQL